MNRGVKDIFLSKDRLLRVRVGVLAYIFATGVFAIFFVSWLFRAPVHLGDSIFDLVFIILFAASVLFNPRVKIRRPKRK